MEYRFRHLVRTEPFMYAMLGLVLIGLLWSLSYNTVGSPLMRDEGEYSYSAHVLRNGGVPYKEAFMQKPPMIIYAYYAAQEISPDAWAPRLLALFSLMCSGLILFAIVRRQYNMSAALAVILVFPALIYYPSLEAFSAQPEVFLILPLVASWWFYFRSRESADVWPLLGVGVCSALAILYKPIVAPAVAFLFLYMGITSYMKAGFRSAVRSLSWVALSVLVSSFLVVLPIIVRGGFSYLIETAFLYNVSYATILWFNNVFGIKFWLSTLSVWLLFAVFIAKSRAHRWLFVGLFAASLAGTAGGFMKHYYIICVPALAVMVSVAIVNIGTLLEGKAWFGRRHSTAVLLTLFMAVMIVPTSDRLFATPGEALYELYNDHSFEASPAIARELSRITSPNDMVFIDGSQPEVLYYAERKSATRFVILYPAILKTRYTEQYDKDIVADLKAHPPEAIVAFDIPQRIDQFLKRKMTSSNTDRYVWQSIHDNYDFVAAIPLAGDPTFTAIRSPNKLEWSTRYYVLYKKKP